VRLNFPSSFVWLRYQPINWAASGLAVGLAVLALVLLVLGTPRDLAASPHGMQRGAGLGLVAWATLAHPMLAPAFGRPWVQAEVIGLAPDPTLIAVLGAALLVQADAAGALTRWLLRAVRVLALTGCTIGAATLWTLGSPQGAVPAVAAVLALGLTHWPRRPEGAVRPAPSQPTGV